MLIDESKESVVALLDVDNFELSKSGFSENGEVMVVGEVARLDVELVEDLSLSDEVGPNLFNLSVLQLISPVVVVILDLNHEEIPVTENVGIDLHLNVAHINKIISNNKSLIYLYID
jgi:hypothetical protein